MAAAMPVSAVIILNIFSSSLLIALNKVLFASLRFPFVTILTAVHFFVSGFVLDIASALGFFERKEASSKRLL
jgi:hypothetical protein